MAAPPAVGTKLSYIPEPQERVSPSVFVGGVDMDGYHMVP